MLAGFSVIFVSSFISVSRSLFVNLSAYKSLKDLIINTDSESEVEDRINYTIHFYCSLVAHTQLIWDPSLSSLQHKVRVYVSWWAEPRFSRNLFLCQYHSASLCTRTSPPAFRKRTYTIIFKCYWVHHFLMDLTCPLFRFYALVIHLSFEYKQFFGAPWEAFSNVTYPSEKIPLSLTSYFPVSLLSLLRKSPWKSCLYTFPQFSSFFYFELMEPLEICRHLEIYISIQISIIYYSYNRPMSITW